MNISNMSIKSKFISQLLIAAFSANFIIVNGQTDGDPYQYNPSDKIFLPTPEQASLLKFTDIPAGNHTGVQGYSVPIYTIQGKKFALPISVSYHGMGIKVNEVSGSVGIGWGLNIGGISLSQEVRGERDQGMYRFNDYFNPSDFTPEPVPQNQAYRDGLAMVGAISVHGYTPEKEFHPDYFSYSLLNNSGRFMLDNNNKAHTIPKDNIKIIGDGPFVITDNKGLVYYFSIYQQENAIYGNGMNAYGGIAQNRVNYGYKIDSIIIPHSNEKITFEYFKVQYAYASSHTVTNKVHFVQNTPVITPSGSNTFGTVTEYLPKSIEYNKVKVNFKYKMNGNKIQVREDLGIIEDNTLDGKAGGILEYIEVVDKTSNTAVKNYKLTTDYFTSLNEDIPNMWGYSSETRANLFKRLKLEGIEEILSGIKYSFEYFGELENQILPPRFSHKTDYWGMYNGKNNTSELHDYAITLNNIKHYFPGGADKNPDGNFAKIGSLKKVFLPTGGYQEFEYELDEFKNTMFDDDNTVFNPVYDYEEESLQVDTSQPNILNTLIPLTLPSQGFSYKVEFSYECNPNNHLEVGQLPNQGDEYYQLELYEGTTLDRVFFKNGIYELTLNSNLNYSFKLIKHGNPHCATYNVPPSGVYINLSWIKENITYPPNRNAGTLRVKSITLNDESGNPKIKRSYSYKDYDYPALSSGKFTGRSLDQHYFSSESGGTYNISNNDIYNLSHSFGKSVVYEKVTETYESTDISQSGNNHKKEYLFQLPDAAFTFDGSPLSPFPHTDYTGGFLLKERIKDYQNKTLKLTTNEYYAPDFFFNQFSFNYFGPPAVLSSALVISRGGNDGSGFDKNGYYITSAWIKLKKTTVEEFENNTLVRSNYTEYAYNENTGIHNELKSILPVSTITGTSLANGTYEEKLKTVYKYPQDLIGIEQNTSMLSLREANIITEPVITETYLVKSGNDTKLSETHIKYNGMFPSEVHFKSGAGTINLNTIEDRKVTYSQYDSNGNILEYILEDGTPVSVVWGYHSQYPILKLEGIGYSSLTNIINNLHAKSNLDTDRCMGINNECKEAELRKNLMEIVMNLCAVANFAQCPPLMVTAYTYDPLLGITSVIQPNGQTQYYNYDPAGRLEEVYIMEKDSGGNPVKRVLKKTKYNYQP